MRRGSSCAQHAYPCGVELRALAGANRGMNLGL
jgi:hypothetical protein